MIIRGKEKNFIIDYSFYPPLTRINNILKIWITYDVINFVVSWKYFLRPSPRLFPIWYLLRYYNMQNIYAEYFDKNPLEIL